MPSRSHALQFNGQFLRPEPVLARPHPGHGPQASRISRPRRKVHRRERREKDQHLLVHHLRRGQQTDNSVPESIPLHPWHWGETVDEGSQRAKSNRQAWRTPPQQSSTAHSVEGRLLNFLFIYNFARRVFFGGLHNGRPK